MDGIDIMGKIFVKMLNIPSVYIDGEVVTFPFKKVEALFYYLLINGQATRDELVALLWPDADEETGRKNLRNAIYHIKKNFNEDVILSDKKAIVAINPNIEIETDIKNMIEGKSDAEIDVYEGEFLKGFFIKQSEEFDQWLDFTREHYKGIYIAKLNNKVAEALREVNVSLAEKLLKSLIGIDEFNEEAYRNLMQLYFDEGHYNKAIDLYNKLKYKLEEELGIMPEVKSIELFEKILESRNLGISEINENKEFFYGREKELILLKNWYNTFVKGKEAKAVVIIGEAGVGKSKLKDRFIKNVDKDKVYIIQTNCYQAEEKYALKPWNNIFSSLSELMPQSNISLPEILKLQAAEEAILKTLKTAAERKKIILIIEDIQWIDEVSLSLINTMMLHEYSKNIMIIFTCRNTFDKKIDESFSLLSRYDKLDRLFLERFTEKEVEGLVKASLPIKLITPELNEKIYMETEGIAFFLMEFINSIRDNKEINLMSSKMTDILKGRFLGITEEGKKVLNLAALFFDYISLDMLREISGKEELYLLEILEELQDKYILKEESYGDKIVYKFTHQKLREFIYLQQSMARKKILHKKVALIMEKSLKNDALDIKIYSHLVYHFTNGGDKLSALKYSIINANTYLDFNHELFPVLEDINLNNGLYLSASQTNKYLVEMEELLLEVKASTGISKEVTSMEIAYLHLIGRHLIREGNYKDGCAKINKMIALCEKVQDKEYALKGYRQMIYYYIQINSIEFMKNTIDRALEMAKSINNINEIGILFRLKGLNKIMSGCYDEAEGLLQESICNLQKEVDCEEKYLLNIAAAYNYIGDIRRYKKDYAGALRYYKDSINLCNNKKVLIGLPLFNTNAGMAAYELGDVEGAKEHFVKALDLYDKLNSMWGRAIAEGYMCLINIRENKKAEAKEHLKAADYYMEKLNSPNEIAIVSKLKEEIIKKYNV